MKLMQKVDSQYVMKVMHSSETGVFLENFGDEYDVFYDDNRKKKPDDWMSNREYFTLERLGQIIAQIKKVIETLYDAKVLHCDIKPENMMANFNEKDEDIHIKLIDFGFAVEINKGRTPSGSPGYMHPTASCKNIFSEIYSFTMVIFDLMFGRDKMSALKYSQGILQSTDFAKNNEFFKGLEKFSRNRFKTKPKEPSLIRTSIKNLYESTIVSVLPEDSKSLSEVLILFGDLSKDFLDAAPQDTSSHG